MNTRGRGIFVIGVIGILGSGCATFQENLSTGTFEPDKATVTMDESPMLVKLTGLGELNFVKVDQVSVYDYSINPFNDRCIPAGSAMFGVREMSFMVAHNNKAVARGTLKEKLRHISLFGNEPGEPPYDDVKFEADWKSLKQEYALRLEGTHPNDLEGTLSIDGDLYRVESITGASGLPLGYNFYDGKELLAQAALSTDMKTVWMKPGIAQGDVIRAAVGILRGRTTTDFEVWQRGSSTE